MPLSHISTDGATGHSDHLNRILSDLEKELRGLAERVAAPDFERFEGDLHQIMASAERALVVFHVKSRTDSQIISERGAKGFPHCPRIGASLQGKRMVRITRGRG